MNREQNASKIIGIDLGTTNSLVTIYEHGQVTVIPNSLGEDITPSVVSMDADGTVYVGSVAKQRLISHPEQTVNVFKSFMGTNKTYHILGRDYRPEELSALILKSLKEDAERYLGGEVFEAIISVPAYFNDMARKATRDGGILAGLKVERIINEPSAAALACQTLNRQESAILLVFDFGGGTLDVSLVECFENIIEIIAVSGDNRLGGSDIDLAIAKYYCKNFELKYEELSNEMKRTLLQSAELVKMELSEYEETTMVVTYKDFQKKLDLSRKQLIEICESIFLRIATPVKKVLQDGNIGVEGIDNVVLVGGSSKMPIIRQYLRYLLSGSKLTTVNPDYMIALGVGSYAGIKERNSDIKDMLLTDICPFSLGVGTHNEGDLKRMYMDTIIERNTALPTSRQVELTTVEDNQKLVDIKVFQGENIYADQNIFLGEMTVQLRGAPKGTEFFSLRYTYDVNGLLVVDATTSVEKKQLLIVNQGNNMTKEEMKKRLKELEKLKIHPKDKEENQLVLALAERLYTQLVGEMRDVLANQTKYFEYLLEKQDEFLIMKWRKHFVDFLENVDKTFVQSIAEVDSGEFLEWFNQERDEEELEDYLSWSSGNLLN